MAVDKSYARLGLFLVVALVLVIATGLFFLLRMRSREVIDFVTYTAGNVSGLDVGSPVRFRGVPLGRVEDLRIEPRSGVDTRAGLVEVDFEVFIDRLVATGANVERARTLAATGSYANFRAQIVRHAVTGEAYLEMDVPPNPSPPMTLPFTPARVYVAFMPTTFDTLQDRLPALMERGMATLQTLERLVEKLPASYERSEKFLANVEQIIRTSDFPGVIRDSRQFFTVTSTQMEKMASDIERITADLDHALGPAGTLAGLVKEMQSSIAAANLKDTTSVTRKAMSETTLAAEDLRRSLPAIRDSLAQLRELARLLEAQPEAVVYGPRSAKEKR